MKIQRKDKTAAGYQIWVSNDGLNCEILEYPHDPSEEEVLTDFQKIIDRQAREQADQDYLNQLLSEEKELLNGNT